MTAGDRRPGAPDRRAATLAVEIRSYYAVNAIAVFGRVVPQATLTPILLEKGLSFGDIIFTQVVFMVVLALTEFPSGYVADHVPRKLVYLASIVVTGAGYGVVWHGHGLLVMCFAWATYALGNALLTSTMDAHFAIRLRSDQAAFKRFFTTDRNIILGATIAAASVSSLVYQRLGDGIYAISLAAFVTAVLAGLAVLPPGRDGRVVPEPSGPDSARPRLRHLLTADPRLLELILLFGITELAFTPFFQLWQMIALDRRISPGYFGALFIAFQLMNMLANVLFRWMPHRNATTGVLVAVMAAVGVCAWSAPGPAVIALLLFLPLPLFLYGNQLEYTLQSLAPAARISSLGSLMGTASTAMAMGTLAAISALLNVAAPSSILAGSLLVFSGVSAILLVTVSRRRRRELASTATTVA